MDLATDKDLIEELNKRRRRLRIFTCDCCGLMGEYPYYIDYHIRGDRYSGCYECTEKCVCGEDGVNDDNRYRHEDCIERDRDERWKRGSFSENDEDEYNSIYKDSKREVIKKFLLKGNSITGEHWLKSFPPSDDEEEEEGEEEEKKEDSV